ncbi:hypothetical protein C2S52_008558 [Perilla frutescens var. hirtella]|nr:hypothetical protein C2S51_017729 [Perilla frutescens var. frutescens]KAH6783599.1 hypothetical protein C2S52_008558 [Perilla frutescens var. hirtella]
MATSRSGAGGNIVTNRRKQRISATPYDRPPPRPSPPKSPNWFAGVVVPSALAIASGAGKILSSIFSDSGSSSSSEEYDSEDDIINDNLPEIPYNRENTLNEENVTFSEMMRYKPESQLSAWGSETKKIIEQLILKETFSREECNMLIKVLNSRVMDWSLDAGEKSSVAGSPREKLHHEDVDIFYKAVQEAKQWFQEKKAGLSSVRELAQGTSNLNSETLEHVETGGGSPIDVARSYMKAMPPWASSGSNIELKTPTTVSMKLFQEGTFYSACRYSTSSSKNRRSFASGSWDIQEELRRVRSRATEDMLCSPTTENDPSHIAVAPIKMRSPVAGEEVFALGERMTEPESLRLHNPIDAWVHSRVSSLAALESRRDSKAIEALLSEPDTSVSGNNEVSEAVQADAEVVHPLSPNHAEELHSAFYWLPDVRRLHEESDKESSNEERGTTLKLERELKRLQTSVNYNARKEKG